MKHRTTTDEILELPAVANLVTALLELLSALLAHTADAGTPPRKAELATGQVDVGLNTLELFTVPEVARMLRLSESTIWRLVRNGAIESVKAGRARRISPEALAAYIRSLTPGGAETASLAASDPYRLR